MLPAKLLIFMEWFSLIGMVLFGITDDLLWVAFAYMNAMFYRTLREGV